MKDIIVKQHDISDCGSCCLLSIIKYYNGFVPLELIKIDTLTNEHGTSFYNIKQAAEKYGFEVNGYQNKKVNPPYIVQTKKSYYYHFIVVYKIKNNNYYCMDPATGYLKYSKEDFNKIFTGNILKLNPINKITTYKKNNYFIKNIISALKDNIYILLLILILSILSIILSLFNTYNIKLIINNQHIITIFIIIALTKNIFIFIKNHLLAHTDKLNNIKISSNYLNHIFHLPLKYLRLKRNGEIVSRINDLHNLRSIYTKEIINIIIYLLTYIIIIFILISLNYSFTILVIFISLIYLIINYFINKKGFKYYLKYLDSNTNLNNQIIEYTNALINIKNLQKEEFFYQKILDIIKDNNQKSYDLDIYLNKLNILNNLFNDTLMLLIIIYNYQYSVTNILLYFLYYNYYIECISYFNNFLCNLNHFKSIISRINGFYYLEKELPKNGFKIGNIEIKNLTYEINNSKIFSNYNLSINIGEKVLIKGPNGIGKSTLLNILAGNITDYQGSIYINNHNINNIDIKNNILYSNNKDILFKDTILNNIILDKPYNKELLSIINKTVYLDKIINKKQNYINSFIDNNLSRGEEERIILARNLYQNKDILLLDESLSDINYELRKKIINNINKNFKDKTIIYVSHNLEENHFNRIIKLTARKEYNAKRS